MEQIRIQPKSMLDVLSLTDAELESLQVQTGLPFEVQGSGVAMRASYAPQNIMRVHKFVTANNWPVEIRHGVWSEFDSVDYDHAPLWGILFPEVSMDELQFHETCESCGRSCCRTPLELPVKHVPSKKHKIFSVNGDVVVVHSDVRKEIESKLFGARFLEFDTSGKYYLLSSTTELHPMIVHPEEVKGYSGTCPKCNSPLFEMYFGPMRFPKSSWGGTDIAFDTFFCECVFSHKATGLLTKIEPAIIRNRIISLQ